MKRKFQNWKHWNLLVCCFHTDRLNIQKILDSASFVFRPLRAALLKNQLHNCYLSIIQITYLDHFLPLKIFFIRSEFLLLLLVSRFSILPFFFVWKFCSLLPIFNAMYLCSVWFIEGHLNSSSSSKFIPI